MEVIVAKTAGFCFGVNRAIKMAKETAEENKGRKLYSLGPLIHNKHVVEELEKKGLTTIDDISDLRGNDTVLIRAHGSPKSVFDLAEEKKINVIDATCPFVKKIHDKVWDFTQKGYNTIIVGDENHPEVIGIKGWNGNALVVGDEAEAEKLEIDGKVCVVAQTTITKEKWDNICDIIKSKNAECEFFNTICNATSERQNEAKEIAESVDAMFVIGDPNSSNSKKLFEISKKYCKNTHFIENADQIEKEWLELQNTEDTSQKSDTLKEENGQNRVGQGAMERGNGAYSEYVSTAATVATQQCDDYHHFRVGITAGASVPANIIEEVINRMSEFEKPSNDEMSFRELFEASMRSIEPEEVLKGKVIRVSNDEIFVDIGYKADGIIPRDEFSDNLEEKPADLFKAGDDIEVYVVKVNDGEGNVLLSRKRIEYIKGWDTVEEAFKTGEILKGIVSEAVNQGVIALIKGVRVFIPASQLSDRPVPDLTQYVKKPVTLKIIDFKRDKKKVVGSCKTVILQEKEEAKKNLWKTLAVGQELNGVVKRLADFGAFVDIGGIDGLIHISELSWGRIKHPSEVLKEGQGVVVRVIDIDKEKEKVALGYRKDVDNPWQSAIEKYEIGNVVKGKVANMMPFGAFVEFAPGLTGLVHISQISNKRIGKPQEALTMGQEVEAKITDIDKEKKKISLSIKETLPVIEEPVKHSEGKAKEEESPSEHKEEMDLTLGDLFQNDAVKSLVKKESAIEKVSDKKALEKVEPKPLIVVEEKK